MKTVAGYACCGELLYWGPKDGSFEPKTEGRIIAECEYCGKVYEALARYDYCDETGDFSGYEIDADTFVRVYQCFECGDTGIRDFDGDLAYCKCPSGERQRLSRRLEQMEADADAAIDRCPKCRNTGNVSFRDVTDLGPDYGFHVESGIEYCTCDAGSRLKEVPA